MLRRSRTGPAVILALLLGGCAGVATPIAVVAPAPENRHVEPTHFGSACAHKIFWVFSYGDSHIGEAKRRSGISDIATVELVQKVLIAEYFPLNIYRKQCTEISGYAKGPA